MVEHRNLIRSMIQESQSYSSLEIIESYLEEEKSLAQIPIQPLYLVLKGQDSEMISTLLPRLSKEQRETFLNLDLWQKDSVAPNNFEPWVMAYAHCASDEIRLEFAKSDQFLLYLKGVFNIWTFDVEDPDYPDHDNYFLTEDNQLLFEFDENYPYIQEIKALVREIYSEQGVELAYCFLFKLVSDSFSFSEEEEYQKKKTELAEMGFVDYHDALALLAPLPSLSHLDHFIKNKNLLTPDISPEGQNQLLHAKSLIAFRNSESAIEVELEKVTDEKRYQYLHFNFVRAMNASLALKEALKEGSVVVAAVSKESKYYFDFALSYLKRTYPDEIIFNKFDFIDLYKMTSTLIALPRNRVKKTLKGLPFEEDDVFLGNTLCAILDRSFEPIPKLALEEREGKPLPVLTVADYDRWNKEVDLLSDLVPFVLQFYKPFMALKTEGQLQDSFYMNYSVDTIDFEAILISSFANKLLANFSETSSQKMGLTVAEYKKFSALMLQDGELLPFEKVEEKITIFAEKFGLSKVRGFSSYLYFLFSESLTGYEFDKLEEEEFKHVGGPIILQTAKVN